MERTTQCWGGESGGGGGGRSGVGVEAELSGKEWQTGRLPVADVMFQPMTAGFTHRRVVTGTYRSLSGQGTLTK